MEAKIEDKETFVSEIREVDKAIVKAVLMLGYDQPADVTIRKTSQQPSLIPIRPTTKTDAFTISGRIREKTMKMMLDSRSSLSLYY